MSTGRIRTLYSYTLQANIPFVSDTIQASIHVPDVRNMLLGAGTTGLSTRFRFTAVLLHFAFFSHSLAVFSRILSCKEILRREPHDISLLVTFPFLCLRTAVRSARRIVAGMNVNCSLLVQRLLRCVSETASLVGFCSFGDASSPCKSRALSKEGDSIFLQSADNRFLPNHTASHPQKFIIELVTALIAQFLTKEYKTTFRVQQSVW
jgi:hypothetical protein